MQLIYPTNQHILTALRFLLRKRAHQLTHPVIENDNAHICAIPQAAQLCLCLKELKFQILIPLTDGNEDKSFIISLCKQKLC